MFITPDTYGEIRAALGVQIDETALPDAIIEMDIHAGRTEVWIVTCDPLADTRTGTALAHLRRAAVFYCASLIAPGLPALTSERFAEYTYQATPVDWAKRAAELLQLANDEVLAVLAPTTVTITGTVMPTFFATASGTRGW